MKKLLLITMLFSLIACDQTNITYTKTVKFIDKSGIDFTYCEFETSKGVFNYIDEQINNGVILNDITNSFKFRLIHHDKVYQSDIDITQDCTIEFYCDSNGMSFKYYYN